MNIKIINSIAMQELLSVIRSRWVMIFSVVFAVIALTISFAGTKISGFTGFQDFIRTTASLLNLNLYLVPLVALILGAMSFASDEPGALQLQISQPVLRSENLLGKYFGLFLAIVISTGIGFGAAGMVIGWRAGASDLTAYIAFVLLSLVLGLIFLSISALISVITMKRTQALSIGLFVWFIFVILYDLLVMWLASSFEGNVLRNVLFGMLFGNPVDLVRVGTLFVLGGKIMFGPTAGAVLKFVGGTGSGFLVLFTALLAWGGLPLALAIKIFSNKDL
ncbi:MAG: ABC transporter permease subunit [Calditrichaceae bacterium]